jgi:hypothetical protein
MVRARSATDIAVGMVLSEKVTLAAVLTLALLSMVLGWNHLSAPPVPHAYSYCAVSATC